jgi:hypothetical protein
MILKLISQILSTVCITVSLMCIISIPFYFLWLWGKKSAQRENEYEQLYKYISDYIDYREISEWNFDFISNELIKLGKLKYKNREKTAVLTVKFFRKYATIARQKVKA